MDKETKTAIKVIVPVVFAILGIVIYQAPIIQTKSTIDKALKALCKGATIVEPMYDAWNNEIRLSSKTAEDGLSIACVGRSAGWDQKMDTNRDIVKHRVNIHVTKAIGTWTGNKMSEFMTGVKKGLTKQSEGN